MSFDTAMWIFCGLVLALGGGTLVYQERQYRKRVNDCRRRWQDEIDRRAR